MKTLLGITAIAATAAIGATWAGASSTTAPVTANVRGKVAFDGKAPELDRLTITTDQARGCCEEGREVDATDRSLLIKDGGIANVVVTIDAADGVEVEPLEVVKLDQKECRFDPHVMVVTVGTKVEFLNSDAIAHNVHTYAGKNDSFNQTIAPGARHEQVLAKADRIEIKCDIHPWMNSHLVVVDTPHYAVTGEDGSFEIVGVRAGEHKVSLWHERLGKGKGTAVVSADGTAELVEIKMGEKKKKKRRR